MKKVQKKRKASEPTKSVKSANIVPPTPTLPQPQETSALPPPTHSNASDQDEVEERPHIILPEDGMSGIIPTADSGATSSAPETDDEVESMDDMDSEEVPTPRSPTPPPVPPTTAPRKRAIEKATPAGSKKTCLFLPEPVERMLGDWLEHEAQCIYDKALPDHADKQKIDRIFAEKGATLDPPLTGLQLSTWYNSIRTRYGKITKPAEASGQGAPKRKTDREKWIITQFAFLHPHIVRQRPPRVFGVEVR